MGPHLQTEGVLAVPIRDGRRRLHRRVDEQLLCCPCELSRERTVRHVQLLRSLLHPDRHHNCHHLHAGRGNVVWLGLPTSHRSPANVGLGIQLRDIVWISEGRNRWVPSDHRSPGQGPE
eukprot:PhF_6_TR925/c2_g1_i8/m.1585